MKNENYPLYHFYLLRTWQHVISLWMKMNSAKLVTLDCCERLAKEKKMAKTFTSCKWVLWVDFHKYIEVHDLVTINFCCWLILIAYLLVYYTTVFQLLKAISRLVYYSCRFYVLLHLVSGNRFGQVWIVTTLIFGTKVIVAAVFNQVWTA